MTALARALRDFPDEVELEVLRAGLRLRDAPSRRTNWRDIFLLIRYAARDSPIQRALGDIDGAIWTISDYLLARIGDSINAGNWQRGGGKGTKPKPIPRPEDVKHAGRDALPVADMQEWLGDDWFPTEEPAADPLVDVHVPAGARDTAIRADLAAGRTRKQVAADFGVSVSTVGRVARNTT